jgi:hypothetical protein
VDESDNETENDNDPDDAGSENGEPEVDEYEPPNFVEGGDVPPDELYGEPLNDEPDEHDPAETTGVGAEDGEIPGVEDGETPGVDAASGETPGVEVETVDSENAGDDDDDDDYVARMNAKYGARSHSHNLRPRKPRDYGHLHAQMERHLHADTDASGMAQYGANKKHADMEKMVMTQYIRGCENRV